MICTNNEFIAQDHNRQERLLDASFSTIETEQKPYILIIFNIADRRIQAEKALRASEERLRLAKQAAGLGIFDYDFKHNMVYWDEQMSMLWSKHTSRAVSYDEFIAAIHPEDRASRESTINHAMDPAGNGEFKAEYRVINPVNNITRWISARGRIYFEDGQPARLVGVTRDVTDQKKFAEKATDTTR